VPWITVNSGQSGNASGTVTFSADINLSQAARTGMITITGLGSSVTVTVSQAGLPAGVSIGGVTITGAEQSEQEQVCKHWLVGGDCQQWINLTVSDKGNISVTVNGYTDSVRFGSGSSASSLAYALAAAINADPNSPVQAGVMFSTVWLVSKAAQGANYSFSSAYTYDQNDFSDSSFTTVDSGPTLTGSP